MSFNHIISAFHNVLEVWRNELKRIIKDQGMLLFLIILPLGYPIIYSWIYNNERISEVPVTVVDLSHSSMSRDFIRKVDAAPDVKVIAHATSLEDARESIAEGKSEGVIFIPSDFSEAINRMQSTRVNVYCDMNGMLYYKAIIGVANDVALEMGKEIQIKLLQNSTNRQDEVSTLPIAYDYVPMFNPTAGYASFIIPAVLMLIIQQALLLGIGMASGTDREKQRIPGIEKNTVQLALGRALAFAFLFLFVDIWLMVCIPSIFSFTQLAQPSALLGIAIPYTLACIFFAMTASSIVRDRESVMLIVVFTSIPFLFISGVSWPGSNIPEFWKIISYVLPSTFGINAFQKVNSMGSLLEDVTFEYQALWCQVVFYFATTCITMSIRKRKILNNEKNIEQ